MYNSFDINSIIALQSSLTSSVNSHPTLIDISGSGQKFDLILNERLNEIIYQKNINTSEKIHENNVLQQESRETGLNSENLKLNDTGRDERINGGLNDNNKDDINFKKSEAVNPDKELKSRKNIQKAEEEDNIKTVKERKTLIDDLSLLLDNLNLLLDIIKNASLDMKQTSELKSILSELRNALGLRNIPSLNMNKEDIAVMDGAHIKKLLQRLKSLLDIANERAGIRNHILGRSQLKDENLSENNSDILNLKKQISRLADEIRQHLINRKPEINSAKSEDSFIEGKNINQKILAENQNIEKNDVVQGKENASSFNFSFSRREPEISGALRQNGNIGFTERKGAFDEQLNTILQNARVVVRDGKNGSFSIRLHPESLGRVNVNLNLEQGVIAGKFLVDSFDAKEALLENMSTVKENLLNNGISVGEFQVNVRGENRSFPGTDEEMPLYNTNKILPVSAKSEYELNSAYLHDGQIDMII